MKPGKFRDTERYKNLYITTVDVRGEHQHADLLMTAAVHMEDGSTSCSGMAAAARTTSSGQPGPPTQGRSQRRGAVQPDFISSSLPENHKQIQTF
jgi:hypothetical protein